MLLHTLPLRQEVPGDKLFISSPDLAFFDKEEEGMEDTHAMFPREEGNGISTVTNHSQICICHQLLPFSSEGVGCFLSGELTEAGSQMFVVY